MWQQIENWRRAERPWWWAYLFAVTVTVFTALLLAMTMTIRRPVGLLLLVPVVLSAYVGGLWPGLISVAIVAAVSPYEMQLLATLQGNPLGSLTSWWLTYPPLAIAICVLLEALHRSHRSSETAHKQLTSILANVSDAVITTSADGRIEYLNRTAAALLRREANEILGHPFDAIVEIRDELSATRTDSLLNRVRGAVGTVHVGARQVLVRADGGQVPIETTLAPVRAASGELLSMVLTIHDCSEQRQTENLLHERLALQARFERIAAVAPGAVCEYLVSADGRHELLYANPYFKQILGVDPATLRYDASALPAMLHPEDAKWVRHAMQSAARQLKTVDIEHRLVTPHRGIRWLVISAVPSRTPEGGTLWHGIMMDVTERKLSEERLRASQLQLQAALEAGEMGVVAIDLSNGSVQMDASARRIWGLDQSLDAELTIEHLIAVMYPDARQAARAEYEQLRATGPQPYRHEYHLLLPHGQERWLVCRGCAYRDEVSGQLVTVGVSVDTTEHRRVHEQRMHSQKLEALGVLAGGIAHDFNNLLLAILGNARLLRADFPQSDPRRVSIQEIDKAAARAVELVRRMLNFSKVPELQQRTRALPLRPMLDDVLGLARAVWPTSVVLETRIPEQLPDVQADSSQLHQALLNLLTNAADAAAVEAGKVQLEVAALDVDATLQRLSPDLRRGLYVRMTVTDNGSGMDEATQQRIFDPFFTTKPTGRGSGLGLAVVHGVMKSMGGAVTVHSSVGRGASFALYFPAQPPSIPSIEALRSTVPATRTAHLLYVDDEEALVFLMSRTLQRMGHRVTTCTSPEQALEKIKAGDIDFDLVVSDMSMPGMSGMELAQQVLALKPQLPFIITSGYLDAADVEHARALGVRQMIMKPNTVEELGLALSNILQEQVAQTIEPPVGQASA